MKQAIARPGRKTTWEPLQQNFNLLHLFQPNYSTQPSIQNGYAICEIFCKRLKFPSDCHLRTMYKFSAWLQSFQRANLKNRLHYRAAMRGKTAKAPCLDIVKQNMVVWLSCLPEIYCVSPKILMFESSNSTSKKKYAPLCISRVQHYPRGGIKFLV